MTTAAQTPRILYSGTSGLGTLGPFAIQTDGTDWDFTDNSHIQVTRFASATTSLGDGTLLVEGTDYDIASNEVTLTSPQTGLLDTERLLIERVEPLTQTLDLTSTSAVKSTAFEARLDAVARQIQDLAIKADRNLKMHWTESTDVELPSVSARANKLLGFDATGKPIAAAADGSDGDPAQPVDATLTALAALVVESGDVIEATGTDTFRTTKRRVATRAALLALTTNDVTTGDIIEVLGYTASGDGGGTKYRVLLGTPASNSLTEDGGAVVENTNNTLTFVALEERFVDPRWFGADGTGATVGGAAVLSAVATGKDVYFAPGTVMLMNGSPIVPAADGQRFFGGGQLKVTSTDADHIDGGERYGSGLRARFFDVYQVDDVLIEGLEFLWLPPSGTATADRLYGVTTEDCDNCEIRNCRFLGATSPAHFWKDSTNPKFKNNYCVGGGEGASFTGAFGIATGGDPAGNTNGSVTGVEIIGNHIEGYVSEGVDINWDTQWFTVSHNVLLNNVQRTDSADEEIDVGGGDDGFECTDGTIENNIIINTTATMLNGLIGIKANPDAEFGSRRITVKGNVGVANNAATVFGCRATSGRDVLVEGNIFSEVGQGIVFQNQDTINCRAINNTIIGGSAATGYGLILGNSSEYCEALDNSIFGTAGARISETAVGAVMRGNKIRNSSTIGIQIDATNAVASGNNISGSNDEGIRLTSTADNVQVCHNYIYNSGQGSASAAIEVVGVDDVMVVGNRCFDDQGSPTQSYGLNITAASARMTISGNNFRGNATGTINGLGNLTNGSVISEDQEQTIRGPSPRLVLHEDDAAADNGRWRINAASENLLIQTENDAESTQANALAILRTGTVVDQIQLNGTDTLVTGTLTQQGVATFEGQANFEDAANLESALNYTGVSTFFIRSRLNGGDVHIGLETGAGTLYYPIQMDGGADFVSLHDSSGETARWDGTAFYVGKSSTSAATVGIALLKTGLGVFTADGATPLLINRETDDGALIDFRQGNTTEGTISVSGTTVSYNGGHLSRWSQLSADDPTDPMAIPKGTVMLGLDEMCEWEGEENEQLTRTKICDTPGAAAVAGVFIRCDHADKIDDPSYQRRMIKDPTSKQEMIPDPNYERRLIEHPRFKRKKPDDPVVMIFDPEDKPPLIPDPDYKPHMIPDPEDRPPKIANPDHIDGDFYIAQTGDFVIRVTGPVRNGDLLESNGDGTARVQKDDIQRASTIAKAAFSFPKAKKNEENLVPCLLMLG